MAGSAHPVIVAGCSSRHLVRFSLFCLICHPKLHNSRRHRHSCRLHLRRCNCRSRGRDRTCPKRRHGYCNKHSWKPSKRASQFQMYWNRFLPKVQKEREIGRDRLPISLFSHNEMHNEMSWFVSMFMRIRQNPSLSKICRFAPRRRTAGTSWRKKQAALRPGNVRSES